MESADWADLPTEDTEELRAKLRWVMHPSFATQVEDFFPDLEVVRREVRDGRRVVVLAPAEMKFEYYALYFDEETGLLNHIGYHNELTDWREVDGVLCPHTFVFGRKGGTPPTGSKTYRSDAELRGSSSGCPSISARFHWASSLSGSRARMPSMSRAASAPGPRDPLPQDAGQIVAGPPVVGHARQNAAEDGLCRPGGRPGSLPRPAAPTGDLPGRRATGARCGEAGRGWKCSAGRKPRLIRRPD